jgi:hypothetical protein
MYLALVRPPYGGVINLGVFTTALQAARAYDEFVLAKGWNMLINGL